MQDDPHATPIQRLNALSRKKQTAFLALFAGAFNSIHIYRHKDGRAPLRPFWGKAECEWVEDWQDFYFREVVDLGFMKPEKAKEGPALGIGNGKEWTFEIWDMWVTEDGFAAREAYWDTWKAELAEDLAAQK